ncbi:MAG: hypothetical protein PWQ47_1167 [Methanothermococcus sp.]|nr:hypothetical protein [Methanothermococcus sp.]
MVKNMSVIIGYYGKNGAVIAGDRRNILFRGDPKKREELEKKLYSGELKSDEELIRAAKDLGINIHIDDEKIKVRKIEDVLVGEVSSIGAESKRRRMYITKGKCAIIDILNDTITNKSIREGSGIVVFGNKYIKNLVQQELVKYKNKILKMSILEIKNLFEEILKNCNNPTVSKKYDVFYTVNCSKNFEETIENDIKDLFNYRNELKKKMFEFGKIMTIVNKIANEGEIGTIKNGKLVLNDDHIAIDKVCPNPKLFTEIEVEGNFEDGDIVVIENGNMKIKGKNENITTKYIVCKK